MDAASAPFGGDIVDEGGAEGGVGVPVGVGLGGTLGGVGGRSFQGLPSFCLTAFLPGVRAVIDYGNVPALLCLDYYLLTCL